MMILTDTNEKATNPVIVARLLKMFPKLEVGNLKCGDVNVVMDNGKLLAIERKAPADFLGSIADGRVFKQVEQMAHCAQYYAIILTGQFSYDDDDMVVINSTKVEQTNWHGKSVRAAMTAIEWSACPIIFSTEYNYPMAIQELIEFCSKPSARIQMPSSHRIVTFPPADERVEILATLPGVGFKRADALLKFVGDGAEYGRLCDALEWASAMDNINEDSRPEGWGKVTLTNFRGIMGLFPTEHLTIMLTEKENSNASKKEN